MALLTIEKRLTGGHPNSLGETIAVVEDVLADSSGKLFDHLCKTYSSDDEVVRLRVSSALKRVCGLHGNSLRTRTKARPDWVLARFDWLIDEIGWKLDQSSAKWSIAQIAKELDELLDEHQRKRAVELLKHNLSNENDWIVQNTTADVLTHFAQKYNDKKLAKWLMSRLEIMSKDHRKSVASRGEKNRKILLKMEI